MRQRLLACGVAVAALAVVVIGAGLAVPAAGGNGPLCVLNTKLVPEEEVPHTSTSAAKGQAHLKLFADGTVTWKVHILNRENEEFRSGHIHIAPFGVPGPVVVPLFPGVGVAVPVTDRQLRDSGSTAAPNLVAAICANPGGYYVNYHTTDNPGGAVRGQLG